MNKQYSVNIIQKLFAWQSNHTILMNYTWSCQCCVKGLQSKMLRTTCSKVPNNGKKWTTRKCENRKGTDSKIHTLVQDGQAYGLIPNQKVNIPLQNEQRKCRKKTPLTCWAQWLLPPLTPLDKCFFLVLPNFCTNKV